LDSDGHSERRGHVVAASRGREILRLALTRAEAADCLGMSVDSFERYVQPEIRLVRRGTLRLVPVAELEGWLLKNADLVLRDGA
jgi:hypothetical protein